MMTEIDAMLTLLTTASAQADAQTAKPSAKGAVAPVEIGVGVLSDVALQEFSAGLNVALLSAIGGQNPSVPLIGLQRRLDAYRTRYAAPVRALRYA